MEFIFGIDVIKGLSIYLVVMSSLTENFLFSTVLNISHLSNSKSYT